MLTAPILTTQRLKLRAIQSDDFTNIKYLLHPEIEKHSGPYMPHSAEDLPVHIERITGDTSWLITIGEDKVIGDIGVFSKVDNRTGELAFYLDPDYWNKGYAAEAGSAVVDYMFNKLNFAELTAPIDSKNVSSRKFAEKLGFTLQNIEYDSDLYGKKADICFYLLKRK